MLLSLILNLIATGLSDEKAINLEAKKFNLGPNNIKKYW